MPGSRFARSAAVSFVVFFLFAQLHAQSTIHVPADQPTIQKAINAAKSGDTVLIAPGTYFENIDFNGKAITVTSSEGAAKTTIDGGGKSNTVTMKSGESRAAVLSNLTITHGGVLGAYGYDGSGVYIANSQPTLLNNVITQNYCQNISSSGSAPLIQGNVVSSSLNPERCFVSLTGGIHISGNLQGAYPAASNGIPPIILGNTIENNTTGQSGDGGGDGGPGIAVWGGSPIIQGNIIRNNNTRSGSGGAVDVVYGDSISIVQNLMYGNTAGCGGGAIGSEMGYLGPTTYLLIANNTIVDNTGGLSGGYSDCRKSAEIWTAFYSGGGPSIKFVNNIIHARLSPAMDCGYLNSDPEESTQSLFDHNLLFDTAGVFLASNCFDYSQLHGNLVADPQFMNLAGGDFHLRSTSPAIDAGNGSVLQLLKNLSGVDLTKDFEGNVREQDVTGKNQPLIDIGAYEFSGTVDATPTRVVLSTSTYSGPAVTNNLLTATLSSQLGVPTGTVAFFIDGQQAGVSTINGGVATLNAPLKPGVHVLYAAYGGQGAFPSAFSVIVLVAIDRYATSMSLVASPTTAVVGQTITYTLHVSSADPGYIPSPIQLTDIYGSAPLPALTPDAAGNATYTVSNYAVGSHGVAANYAGDKLHGTGYGSAFVQVVNGYSTTATLSSSANPANLGQTVLFKAHVSSTNGTPTGSVQFTDGSTVLGASALDSSGNASLSTSTLTVGTHAIVAAYTPTGAFAGSQAAVSQVVSGLKSQAVLTANPITPRTGDPVNLAATISAASPGGPMPTGTVTFYSNGSIVGSNAVDAYGIADIGTSSLPFGSDSLTCVYSGDSVYSGATCAAVAVNVLASDTALRLVTSANPTPALTPVTFTATLTSRGLPNSGSVHFLLDGKLIAGGISGAGGATSIQLTLPVGAHSVTAEFSGTPGLNPSTASLTETAVQNPTSTILVSPQGAIYENQRFSFSATVKASTGTAQAYGVVTLLDGSTPIASQTIASAQSASTVVFALAPLSLGGHLFSAVYAPADGNFAASSSAQVSVTILPQTFLFTSAAPSVTIQTEHHGSMALTLTSVGGWAGPVQLACAEPLPPVLTCDVASSVTLAANGTSSTLLRLDTDAVLGFKSELRQPVAPFRRGVEPLIAVASLLLPMAYFGCARRRLAPLLMAFVLLGGLTALSGCSGKYPDHTPPGTYTLTLTASGTAAGATAPTSQTLHLTLIVTP